MRVFIGVELQESVKETLLGVQKKLQSSCVQGNFTAKDNFHLTLQFIGEVSTAEVQPLQTAVSKTAEKMSSFEVLLDTIGEFPKKNRSVVWLGPNDLRHLTALYDKLHLHLAETSLHVNKGAYIPHVTLGRKILLTEPFAEVKQKSDWIAIPLIIDNVTLFESVRLNDQLVYRPIAKSTLNQ